MEMGTFAYLKQLIRIIGLLLKLEGVVLVSRTRKKLSCCDFIEDFSTDDIRWIVCPAEPNGEDKIGSCEVNYTTGQFYFHNCHRFGTIDELYRLAENKLLL